jgi:hypothetical protein
MQNRISFKIAFLWIFALLAFSCSLIDAAPPVLTQRPMIVWPASVEQSYLRSQIDQILGQTPVTDLMVEPMEGARVFKDFVKIEDVTNPQIVKLMSEVATYARQQCANVGINIDFKQALPAYEKLYPGETLSYVSLHRVSFNARGTAVTPVSAASTIGRLVTEFPHVKSQVLRGWAFKEQDGKAIASSLVSIDKNIDLKFGPEEFKGRLTVNAGSEWSGASGLILVRHDYRHPDQFSQHMLDFQTSIVDAYRGSGLKATYYDEMGFPNEGYYPVDRAWAHPWWSPELKRAYEARTQRNYEEDLFYRHVPVAGKPELQIRANSAYYDLLRDRASTFERTLYNAAKKALGDDSFIGTHPTWYGVQTSFYQYDYERNGFNWWEAARDVAQIDEVIDPSFALGMARNRPANYFIRMNYNFPDRLWALAAADVPYGGRTHYCGTYGTDRGDPIEDNNDWAGAQLSNVMAYDRPQRLAAFEEKTVLIDQLTDSLPKPRALVVFGYYAAAASWLSNPNGDTWRFFEPGGNLLLSAAELARALRELGYVVDVVPSTEVDAGRITVNAQGEAVYGGQRYPATILAYPEYSRDTTRSWFANLKNRAVLGAVTRDADGADVESKWQAVLETSTLTLPTELYPFSGDEEGLEMQAPPWPANPHALAAAQQFIAALKLDAVPLIRDGVELASGTVILTRSKATGGLGPERALQIQGHAVTVKMSAAGELLGVAGDQISGVTVNDRTVLNFDQPYDLSLRRTSEKEAWQLVYRGAAPTEAMLLAIKDHYAVREVRCQGRSNHQSRSN